MPVSKLFEPEEAIGALWHRVASDLDAEPGFPEAAVELERVGQALAVTFRGLGGTPLAELKAAPLEASGHRLTWRRRLGRAQERRANTRFDGETLFLPPRLAVLPSPALNRRLYLWLVAWCACTEEPAAPPADALQADFLRLRQARATTSLILARFPGLRLVYRELTAAYLPLRPERRLPPAERWMEDRVQDILRGSGCGELSYGGRSVPGYRPFLPVPLWAERVAPPGRGRSQRDDAEPDAADGDSGAEDATLKAKRQQSSEAERKDSLILHRFESVLSWAEFLDLNRMVDDDDAENAKRAAEDHDDISLTDLQRRPATRLKFDLDLAPEDVERERLAGRHLFPEWDYRTGTYLGDHVRVLSTPAEDPEDDRAPAFDEAARRRIERVRRQFEALRPKRRILPRQLDGDDLDLDAAIRARCDFLATGAVSNRLYRQARDESRDLAVAVLLDTSRSTESYVDNRPVLEIEKEALAALAYGLQHCGDDLAIHAFSSLKRHRVFVQTVKRFDQPMDRRVEARIAALRPGFYTRLGAALRYVTQELTRRANQRRLLLVLTDGKPNDLDHYEGRYGIEDTRRAILEARRAGHAAFGITVDGKARSYIPRIFGQNGFAILSHPDRLTHALPAIYRHLVQ